MIMNTRDKEITDQPRLNHFDLKSNSTCNIYTAMQIAIIVIVLHTSSEKHVASGSFQSRRRSGNQIINAVCFVVFLVLTNFYKKNFQP